MTVFDRSTSRRGLITGSAALAGAAAWGIHGQPPPRTVAATQGTPMPAAAPAELQVLRWGWTAPIRRVSVAGYGGPAMDRFMSILWLPPFLGTADGGVEPGVCLDYSVSEDNLTYTFNLDPAAKFSDGGKITAGDLKYTFEYMATPESGNPFPYYQTQAVLGHDAVRTGESREMAGLAVVDDETLQITLSRPFSPFIAYMTQCLNGIHQRADIENGGPDWDKRPTVTSGPFMVESFDMETGEIVMVRNPYWWRESSAIERIETVVAPDQNTLAVLWDNDELDIVERPRSTAGVRFGMTSPNTVVADSPCPLLWVIGLRTTAPPMDDVDVRRALVMATDPDSIVPALYQGIFRPSATINTPIVPGHVDRPTWFDPVAAKAALAASRYGGPDGLDPVIFAVGPQSDVRQAAEAIQQDWQEILGIEPAILPTDPGFDANEIGANVWFAPPGPLFLDTGCMITWAFKSDNNYFTQIIQVEDGEIDGLIEQAEALPFTAATERAALYAQAEELMIGRGYVIPFAEGVVSYLIKPWVAGAEFRPDTAPIIERMYVAER